MDLMRPTSSARPSDRRRANGKMPPAAIKQISRSPRLNRSGIAGKRDLWSAAKSWLPSKAREVRERTVVPFCNPCLAFGHASQEVEHQEPQARYKTLPHVCTNAGLQWRGETWLTALVSVPCSRRRAGSPASSRCIWPNAAAPLPIRQAAERNKLAGTFSIFFPGTDVPISLISPQSQPRCLLFAAFPCFGVVEPPPPGSIRTPNIPQ